MDNALHIISTQECTKTYCPETELWASVLKRAMLDLFSDNKYLSHRARYWFLSTSKAAGSLQFVCDVLDINIHVLYRRLYRYLRLRSFVDEQFLEDLHCLMKGFSVPVAETELNLNMEDELSTDAMLTNDLLSLDD